MTSDELKEIIAGGETSTVQFKRQLDSMDGIAAEIIAMSNTSEQIRLFQQSGLLFVDEMIVPETSIADIDKDKVQEYLRKINEDDVDLDFGKEQIYRNIGIVKDNRLTLAGLLFFGKHPQRYRPAFCIKAVAFYGNDIAETHYRDSLDITGTIPKMFEEGMRFFNMNLFHTQQGQDFNSVGKLEISEIALQELLQNALTHRDYSKNAPVRLFVFDNRIEIISPGCLPNSLTIENILMGNAVVRNNLIVSYASKLMKYRGLGSGVARAARNQPDLELYNDKDGKQFRVVIPRKS